MSDRQLIADLLSALEYHTEQTRPIEFSRVAIEAAREYLRKPAQQQEPVLWQILNGVCHAGVRSTENLAKEAAAGMQKTHDLGGSLAAFHVRPLYTSPPAQQEPVAWMPIEQMYPQAKAIDILMGDGSILCAVLPQFDGDLWWEGSGTGEKFIDPKYANVTHWRIHDERTSPPASKPLTDEEIMEMFNKVGGATWISDFARAIEAAHQIGVEK